MIYIFTRKYQVSLEIFKYTNGIIILIVDLFLVDSLIDQSAWKIYDIKRCRQHKTQHNIDKSKVS